MLVAYIRKVKWYLQMFQSFFVRLSITLSHIACPFIEHNQRNPEHKPV